MFRTASLVLELNELLRSATVRRANAVMNIADYVPWLSIIPLISEPISAQPILYPVNPRGSLVINREYLDPISDFLQDQGRPIVETSGFQQPFEVVRVFSDIAEVMPDAGNLYWSAIELLKKVDRWYLLFTSLVDVVIPLDRQFITGLSSHYCRGAIFIAFFPNLGHEDLAVGLVHETAHQYLNVCESADTLIASAIDTPVYSGVRKTTRPAIQAFHAAAALSFMLSFCIEGTGADISGKEAAYLEAKVGGLRDALRRTIHDLSRVCKFTELGSALIAEFNDVLFLQDGNSCPTP
jgi:hypothetical protein